jgi:GxxExxY protein
MRVHRELGPGFVEAVYSHALDFEFRHRGIPAKREVPLDVRYRGHVLPVRYREDFVCYDGVLVELKAVAALGDIETAQVIHYLNCTGMQIGIILNFASRSLEFRRFICGPRAPTASGQSVESVVEGVMSA